MGAWGTQPKDNDGSWDLADEAFAEAEKWLAKRWAKLCRLEGRQSRADALFVRAGAVQILLERGVFVRRALVEDAVKDLRTVLGTPEYMRTWRDPSAARRSIPRVLVEMEGLLKQGFWKRRRTPAEWAGVRPGCKRPAKYILSGKPLRGGTFFPSSHILAPVGWPRKDAGKRSWTGIERHRRHYRRSHPRRRATR